jgi:hypothetical protein
LGIIYQISYVYLHAVGFLSVGGKSRLLLYHTTTLESNMSLCFICIAPCGRACPTTG